MIKVNLLATNPGAAPPKEWFPQEQRSSLIGAGILFASLAGLGGYWYYQRAQAASVTTSIAAAEAEIVRLKAAALLVEQTTARKTELNERLSLIERLRDAKREPVTLLETVSRSVPEGLWLMEIRQGGASVQIDGRATSLTAVTDFTERLQVSGFFKRPVEIVSTGSELLEETEVFRFTVKADPVPAATGTGTATPPPGTVAGGVTGQPGV